MRARILSTASFLLLLPLLASTHATAASESAGIKVYTGAHGIEVAIVQLKEPGKFLVQVTGSGSAFDGLVLPYDLDASGRHYSTSWRGQPYAFLSIEKARGGGAGSMSLYTPGDVVHGQPLTYSEARSRVVQPAELLVRHEQQTKDGSVVRFGRFDRAGEQALHDKSLAEAAKSFNQACATKIPATIVWSSISDEQIKSLSISSYCSSPLSAMERLCQTAEVRSVIQAKVKQVTCQFGTTMKMDVDEKGSLIWTTFKDATNTDEFAQKSFEDMTVATPSGGTTAVVNGEAPPWGRCRTLGEQAILAKTIVCSDGKSSFVVVAPDEHRIHRLYYGNGKKFSRVPQPEANIGGDNFFDPRNYNASANPNFRGADMRLYSSVEVDEAKKSCVVQCGAKRAQLSVLDAKIASATLRAASFEPPLHKRKPHVLTRDDKGTYYYVDRGNTPETEKNFRLFVGRRGNLRLQAMTNIIADSQGEIFSTKSGSLRFIAGPGGYDSSWVQGKKVIKLTAIPVEGNYGLIYNDLGVYAGERLGTPCDDL